jgi:post-segregation antitoxin (ccd killing protein)
MGRTTMAKKEPMESDTVKATFTVDRELMKEFKITAIKVGLNFSQAVSQAMEDFIKRNSKG